MDAALTSRCTYSADLLGLILEASPDNGTCPTLAPRPGSLAQAFRPYGRWGSRVRTSGIRVLHRPVAARGAGDRRRRAAGEVRELPARLHSGDVRVARRRLLARLPQAQGDRGRRVRLRVPEGEQARPRAALDCRGRGDHLLGCPVPYRTHLRVVGGDGHGLLRGGQTLREPAARLA